MVGQICDLDTVQLQEIPIKVYIMCYNAMSDWLYQGGWEKKASFLAVV